MRMSRSGTSWIVHTPAKLNLFLEVLGKRSDGFHELETVIAAVDLYDTLIFTEEPTEEVTLRCFDAGCALQQDDASKVFPKTGVPDGRDNLAVKAAELIRSQTGIRRGIRMELFKRIPTAAGLAGGSSDAAAVLFALNRIWNLGLGRDELQKLASTIGSDVSFFLSSASAAVCRGRGEVILPIRPPFRLSFVIAKPRSGLSTADVYRQCRPVNSPRGAGSLIASLQQGDLNTAGRLMFNSLQAPAAELNSDVRRLDAMFSQLPLVGHMMSGSGTAWFGVCRHRQEARTAAARLRALGPGRVFVAESPP